MKITFDLNDKLLAGIKKHSKGKTINEIANLALDNYVKKLEENNLNIKINIEDEN